jgi:hypothetical protein
MKSLLALVGLLFLGACSQGTVDQKTFSVPDLTETERFNYWLGEHDLKESDFVDSVGRRAFELWAYSDPITKSDSSKYWYPSTDSSFYLVSNYNVSDGSRIEQRWSDIELGFHKTGTNEIRIGMALLDSTSKRRIDIHWRNESSIYILEKIDEELNYMMLLNMKNDSIWEYET